MSASSIPIEGDGAYLARLGERVRSWRTEQAITRKELSKSCGISERYIGLLESGQGNISIVLLRKLARAMRMPLATLVADDERIPRSERIALLGLRGAGKSTLGEGLARLLHLPFFELDKEAEREAGMKLAEVLATHGQDAFRRFELRALERILEGNSRAVISTGGSIVTEPKTYELLLQECVCLWLRASPEEHMSRVIAQDDMRPLKGRSAALQEIRQLLKDRERLYARADAVVETSGKTVRQSLQQMKNLLA